MKKINFYLVSAFVSSTFFFSSCEKDEVIKEIEVIKEVEVPVEISKEVQRISFENVELNSEGFQNNFTDGLILSDVDFYNYFDEIYSSWEGLAVSNQTDKETAGYENEFSVYATGGANGSEKFGVVFAGFNETSNCKFLGNQEFQFKSLMINNSTYAVLEIQNGGSFSKKFEEGDWFKIIITGFKANGEEAGTVEFYLADFRDGKSYICQDWTSINLSSLGKVNKLEFTFDSTDISNWGINTPTYACIDDIIYMVE
jgi:hypothetical protein